MKLEEFKTQLMSPSLETVHFTLDLINNNINKKHLTEEDYEWLAKKVLWYYFTIVGIDAKDDPFYHFWVIKPFYKNRKMEKRGLSVLKIKVEINIIKLISGIIKYGKVL